MREIGTRWHDRHCVIDWQHNPQQHKTRTFVVDQPLGLHTLRIEPDPCPRIQRVIQRAVARLHAVSALPVSVRHGFERWVETVQVVDPDARVAHEQLSRLAAAVAKVIVVLLRVERGRGVV